MRAQWESLVSPGSLFVGFERGDEVGGGNALLVHAIEESFVSASRRSPGAILNAASTSRTWLSALPSCIPMWHTPMSWPPQACGRLTFAKRNCGRRPYERHATRFITTSMPRSQRLGRQLPRSLWEPCRTFVDFFR